jgi:hypothetical protein
MAGNSQEADTESEQNLWKAVVLQALLDAAGQSRGTFARWPDWKHQAVKREALRWLLVDKEDFFDVCEMAGIDARIIREFSKRLLNNETEAQLLVINFRDSFYKRGKKSGGEEYDPDE